MALIKEDGTNVANANTYADVSDLDEYAQARGITLTQDAAGKEVLLVKAMDYLQTLRDEWQGRRSYTTQRLQWPRAGVYVEGFEVADTYMPEELLNAQCELALTARTIDLMPTRAASQFKTMEKIGPLETRWSEGQGFAGPSMPRVDALLSPLLRGMRGVLTNYRG